MSRILIKLSGEALAGPSKDTIFDESVLAYIVESISKIKGAGNDVVIVVGGGNIFRGSILSGEFNVNHRTADFIGMLATIQNGLVLADYFTKHGLKTVVTSAVRMEEVCEYYSPNKVSDYLDDQKIVILAGGLAEPSFTTDTTAVTRSLELSIDEVIYVKNGVDGLYTADPKKDRDAIFIKEISAKDVLEKDLKGLDTTAVALARDNNLTLRIIGMKDLTNLLDLNCGSIINPN